LYNIWGAKEFGTLLGTMISRSDLQCQEISGWGRGNPREGLKNRDSLVLLGLSLRKIVLSSQSKEML